MMSKRIDLSREAAGVRRFHTARLVQEETIAHHSFNMCQILLMMTDGQVSKTLLCAAIMHDIGEYVVGDIPSPTKGLLDGENKERIDLLELEAIQAIHPYLVLPKGEEVWMLKLADCLDGLLKCRDELRLGNRNIRAIGDRYVDYIYQLTDQWDTYRVFAQHCVHLYQMEL